MANNKKVESFKAAYLRVLSGQQPSQSDWWAARELIDNGHAAGHYQVSKSHLGYGQVTALIGFSPTLQGRLFADELASQQRKSTWRYRIGKAALGLASFGAGWLAGVLSKVSESALLQWLGLG